MSPLQPKQALSALLFLYREVLEQDLPWMAGVVRAKRPARLPVVLTEREVSAILERMHNAYGLLARLLYGTGMRVMECVRLRVKDIAPIRPSPEAITSCLAPDCRP